jgi:hypothetical protein
VDLENATLTIRQAIQRIDGKLTIVPTKKDKIHTVKSAGGDEIITRCAASKAG